MNYNMTTMRDYSVISFEGKVFRKMTNVLEQKLEKYAENHLNVLLIGSHGIGKSSLVKGLADKLNVKFKYYSSSTLDPFADIVGIPMPDKETNTLEFCRPKDLVEAEFLFFDELNRAHPRVLNAVLEIIQFKTVNGTPLKNLKMVWAAINPPGENYQVEDLDPALIDRFHCYIKMKSELNIEYLSTKMKPEIAAIMRRWWDNLSDHQKTIFTPRRVEYVGFMISNQIPWKDSIPQGHPFPLEELEKSLKAFEKGEEEVVIDKKNVLERKDYFVKELKKNPKIALPLKQVVAKMNNEQKLECRDIIELLPQDLINDTAKNVFLARNNELKELFVNSGVNLTQYPKISKAFGWDKA